MQPVRAFGRVLKFSRALPKSTRSVTSATTKLNSGYETDEWFVFPREKEGNIYTDNWSLVGDGVTPIADAFRNARPELLYTRTGVNVKTITSRLEAQKPAYEGEYKLVEAGDKLSQDEFEEIFADTKSQLSSGVDLFVEDLAVGSFSPESLGVRVITDNANVALMARTFLFPQPPRAVNFRARAKGWNLDERWAGEYARQVEWKGDRYVRLTSEEAAIPAAGERPIVVYVSNTLDTNEVAVQWLSGPGSAKDQVVGANIVFGQQASVRGLIEAIGHAASVISNTPESNGVVLPSTVVTKAGQSVVVLGLGKEDNVLQGKTVYGAYYNHLSTTGISAVFNGAIVAAPADAKVAHAGTTPLVVVKDKATATIAPDNKTFPASTFVIVDTANALAGKKTLTSEEAVAYVAKTYGLDQKEAALTALFANTTVQVVSKAADVSKLL